jgi:hypothetical protein
VKKISLVALGFVVAACTPLQPAASPKLSSWTSPDRRYQVDLPGQPVPRDVQEINGTGTIDFKVYGTEAEPYVFRVAALPYVGPIERFEASFDPKEELWHSSGKKVARMGGTVEKEEAVATDDGHLGRDVTFLVEDEGHRGRGVLRAFITRKKPFVRYEALCIAPVDVDFAPCTSFVQSFRPLEQVGASSK